ncbi:glycoside hydrolase family 76 protein [Puia sp. P3]|uniref:glycoside hydrolase family 76 protein n=1 Tax=Puia sp. P3 TaxID=3423952 RepID=UPI003D66C174
MADTAERSLDLFWSAGNKYYLASNTSSDWAQYWPRAHALDVLTDAYLRNPSTALKDRMTDLLTGVRIKNFGSLINNYYDDMQWMALACLRAYSATSDNRFKGVTDTLWADIKNGWSSDLGGGIWWRKDNPSKNTPSNMPAAILAARLYKIGGNSADLQWAQKIYDWERSTLYEPATGLVYDNIDNNGNKNTSWKFTYNQGTFLGAALELYENTGSSLYLSDALQAADYTLNSGMLTSNGLLKDEGGGDEGTLQGNLRSLFHPTHRGGQLRPFQKKRLRKFSPGQRRKPLEQGHQQDQRPVRQRTGTRPPAVRRTLLPS